MLEFIDSLGRSSTKYSCRGGRPGNKRRRYPADPPRVEEIVDVMRQAGTDAYGQRLRGLIVVLWRAGLRISDGPTSGPAVVEFAGPHHPTCRGSTAARSSRRSADAALRSSRLLPH
jgi:hypothetical protein